MKLSDILLNIPGVGRAFGRRYYDGKALVIPLKFPVFLNWSFYTNIP